MFKDFFNVGFGTFINMFLGLVTTPLITRIVDPASYGKFNLFISHTTIFVAIVFFGLDQVLTRFFYENDDFSYRKSLLKLCFILPICLSIIVFTIAYFFVKIGILKLEYTNLLFCLLCLNTTVTVLNTLSNTLLKVLKKSKVISICTVIQKIIYCTFIIIYVISIKNNYLLMLILATIISLFVSFVIALFSTKEYWKFAGSSFPKNAKVMLKYGAPFIPYAILLAVFDSLDKIMVDYYCSEYEVGIYTSALVIVGIFVLIQTTFNTIWQPLQAQHYIENYDDTSFIQKGNRYITIIMMFVGINVIMFKDVLCLLLGESYRDASTLIPFLVFNPIMYTISETTLSGIESSKKSYLHIVVAATSLICNLLLCNYLIPRLGVKGACISVCMSLTVFCLLRTFLSIRNYYIDYGIKKFIAMIVVLFVFAYINTFMEFSFITIIAYIVCIILFVFIYLRDIKTMINDLTNLISSRKFL